MGVAMTRSPKTSPQLPNAARFGCVKRTFMARRYSHGWITLRVELFGHGTGTCSSGQSIAAFEVWLYQLQDNTMTDSVFFPTSLVGKGNRIPCAASLVLCLCDQCKRAKPPRFG